MHSLGMSTFNGSTEGLVKERGEDSIRMSMHWLKVTSSVWPMHLFITAEPNTTGKRRRLYIDGMAFNNVITIKVVQKER